MPQSDGLCADEDGVNSGRWKAGLPFWESHSRAQTGWPNPQTLSHAHQSAVQYSTARQIVMVVSVTDGALNASFAF